ALNPSFEIVSSCRPQGTFSKLANPTVRVDRFPSVGDATSASKIALSCESRTTTRSSPGAQFCASAAPSEIHRDTVTRWIRLNILLGYGRHMDQFWMDVRYSLRTLRKNPGFAFVAISVLALGIGATTAIFSVVNAVLIRPLPYKDPSRLTAISSTFR